MACFYYCFGFSEYFIFLLIKVCKCLLTINFFHLVQSVNFSLLFCSGWDAAFSSLSSVSGDHHLMPLLIAFKVSFNIYIHQICPGLNANEIQIPYDKHHKVSSSVKTQQNTQCCQIWSNMKMSNNPAKYELLIKQCLRSISPGHKCLFQAATCFWVICKTKKMKFAFSNWYTEPNR